MVPGTVKEGFFPSPEEDAVVISLDDDDDDISIVDLSSDSEVDDDVEMRPPISAAKLKEVEARIGKYIGFMDDLPSSPGNFIYSLSFKIICQCFIFNFFNSQKRELVSAVKMSQE